MKADRFKGVIFQKPRADASQSLKCVSCSLCITCQPKTYFQILPAQRVILGKGYQRREKVSTSTLSSVPHTPSKNLCFIPWTSVPCRLCQAEPHLHTLGSGPPPRSCGEAGDPLHIQAPLVTKADLPRGSSLRNSGYVSGFPSGLDKTDNTQRNTNTDLETYKHTFVCTCIWHWLLGEKGHSVSCNVPTNEGFVTHASLLLPPGNSETANHSSARWAQEILQSTNQIRHVLGVNNSQNFNSRNMEKGLKHSSWVQASNCFAKSTPGSLLTCA